MLHSIVDDQQAKLISEATEGIEIRDSRGRHLGYVAHGFSDENLAIAKERMASGEPRYTTREVLDHLRSEIATTACDHSKNRRTGAEKPGRISGSVSS